MRASTDKVGTIMLSYDSQLVVSGYNDKTIPISFEFETRRHIKRSLNHSVNITTQFRLLHFRMTACTPHPGHMMGRSESIAWSGVKRHMNDGYSGSTVGELQDEMTFGQIEVLVLT